MNDGGEVIVRPGIKAALLCTTALCALASAVIPGAAAAKSSPTVSGKVTKIDQATAWIQTSGSGTSTVAKMVSSAEALQKHDYPYVYGGGHAHAGTPSRGSRGHAVGYDCSGAVAAVLASGGLWQKGSGVPSDTGMIQELLKRHEISRGAGSGFDSVTLYDIPGHIYMSLDGTFYGTGGDRKGGPGWYGVSVKPGKHYRLYHFRASLLKGSKTPRQVAVAVENSYAGALQLDSIPTGTRAQFEYKSTGYGTMRLIHVIFGGAKTASGEVTSLAMNGTKMSITASSGTVYKLVTPKWPFAGIPKAGETYPHIDEGAIYGADVKVTYTASGSGSHAKLTIRAIKVTSRPPLKNLSGTVTAIGKGQTSFTLKTESGTKVTVTWANCNFALAFNPHPMKGTKIGTAWEFKAWVPSNTSLPATVYTS